MRLTATHCCAVAVTAAALAAAGCSDKDSPAPAAKPAAASAGEQVQRYIKQVGQIRQSLDDARSAYFHAPPRRAAIRRETSAVQKAYAAAVRQLDGIKPPKLATDVHSRIRDQWAKRAEQLEHVLADETFSTGRVDDVMAATDRDTAVDDVYTIPY